MRSREKESYGVPVGVGSDSSTTVRTVVERKRVAGAGGADVYRAREADPRPATTGRGGEENWGAGPGQPRAQD
ncbi:hypothetical protein ACFXPY_32325, partial [Streptomyces sp. NPDC059153]|uniref:hypothetical protein n=1 Tax=Streptomyces sp. NPDC059153 TaxID=3346743 RepID=UPI00367B35B4